MPGDRCDLQNDTDLSASRVSRVQEIGWNRPHFEVERLARTFTTLPAFIDGIGGKHL